MSVACGAKKESYPTLFLFPIVDARIHFVAFVDAHGPPGVKRLQEAKELWLVDSGRFMFSIEDVYLSSRPHTLEKIKGNEDAKRAHANRPPSATGMNGFQDSIKSFLILEKLPYDHGDHENAPVTAQ